MLFIEIPEISGASRIKKHSREEACKDEDPIEQLNQIDPSALPLILQEFHHDDILEEPDRILIMYLVPSDIRDVTFGVSEDGTTFQISFKWPILSKDEMFTIVREGELGTNEGTVATAIRKGFKDLTRSSLNFPNSVKLIPLPFKVEQDTSSIWNRNFTIRNSKYIVVILQKFTGEGHRIGVK